MSFRHTWMATQGLDEEAVLSGLAMEIVGEIDDYYGAPLTLARMPGGWLLIVSYKEPPFDRWAPKAVPEGFVLTGHMNEIAMYSELRGFQDGLQAWAVVRNCEVVGLGVEGTPPDPFNDIYRAAQDEQAKGDRNVDYLFDVPVELSAAMCGFTPAYDMDVTWLELIEVKPQRAAKEGKGFFARLFGR